MKKHFVHFLSPGTFVSEESAKPITSWDVDVAKEMAHHVTDRHGAIPYGFFFTTRERGPNDLDSKETMRSGIYYLGGIVETAEQVLARNDPREDILRSNIRCNGYDRIITNTNSWKHTAALHADDVVLEWTP